MNKTSEAVDEMLDSEMMGTGMKAGKNLYSIFQKYKRMEEALEKIEFTIHAMVCTCPHKGEWCKECEQSPECETIRDALLFDPLDTDE